MNEAMADPLYRVGLRLEVRDADTLAGQPSLETDLRAIATSLGERATDAIRFSVYLRHSQFDLAAEQCSRMKWPHCSTEALRNMRANVTP